MECKQIWKIDQNQEIKCYNAIPDIKKRKMIHRGTSYIPWKQQNLQYIILLISQISFRFILIIHINGKKKTFCGPWKNDIFINEKIIPKLWKKNKKHIVIWWNDSRDLSFSNSNCYISGTCYQNISTKYNPIAISLLVWTLVLVYWFQTYIQHVLWEDILWLY